MNAIDLLLLSISLYGIGAILSLLFSRSKKAARLVAGFSGLIAAVFGVSAALIVIISDSPVVLNLFSIPPFGWLGLNMDVLSSFLVGLIALIGAAASIYSLSSDEATGFMGFLTNIFLATMLLVVTINNAFYFIVFWEMMTLVSYLLVIWESEKEETMQIGYVYMLVAHIGAALILVAFLIMYSKTSSFDFGLWRQTWMSTGIKSLVFILAFIGFGAKAGMVPLHFWAPGAYAVAPDHVSALMSSVMKKTAIYGFLRICIDIIGPIGWGWGFLVLIFGVLSTVIGAFYALTEKDLKRLLAYSSVENVGIILMGCGVGMIGISIQQPVISALGFLAALYHMINHAFFKGLLFLGAGSVITQVGSRNLNQMGGLARRMPWTAVSFLIGVLAVTAIPPLNGFVSEWFTYQALFASSQTIFPAFRVFSPLFAVLLALAGGFAVMVYIKAYSGAFSGPARSKPASDAKESALGKIISMIYLAVGCLVLGLGSPIIAPWISNVAADFIRASPLTVASGWQVFPGDPAQAAISPPLVALLLLGFLLVPVILIIVFKGQRAGRRTGVEPWSCGYGYSPSMSVIASSFDQPVKTSFVPLFWLRTLTEKPFRILSVVGRGAVQYILKVEPVVETVISRPTSRLVETAGQWVQNLQMGDIRVYCLYIIVTLAVLLIVIFGGSGL